MRRNGRGLAVAVCSVAAACFVAAFPSAQTPTRDELLAALRNPEAKARSEAARRLGAIGGEGVVPALVAALADKESEVRAAAAEALGALGDPAATEPLIAALRTVEPRVYRAAAVAIGRLGSGVFDRLVAELGSTNEFSRRGTALALAALGDTRAVEPLKRLLADRIGWVRSEAAVALAKLNDPSSIPAVAALLADRDARVVGYVAGTLADWKDGQGGATLDAVLTQKPVNLAAVAGAYEYFIRKADADGCRDGCPIQRVLIDALLAHGSLPMPQDFYHCRNESLRMAARVWAQHHGESPASWFRPRCAADAPAAGPAPIATSDAATVVVIHAGGKSIDVEAGNSSHGVVTNKRYMREIVRPGRVKIQARMIDGYQQRIRYRLVIGRSPQPATFTHSNVVDTLYLPRQTSRMDRFWLDLEEMTISPYVWARGVAAPPATEVSIADLVAEAGQTYYFAVQENDKRVQVRPLPADQGKALVDKNTPTGARFFATAPLTGVDNYLPVGEATTVQDVTPVCARFRSDGFTAECGYWRLLRDDEQVRSLKP
jgi:hypothetical protein